LPRIDGGFTGRPDRISQGMGEKLREGGGKFWLGKPVGEGEKGAPPKGGKTPGQNWAIGDFGGSGPKWAPGG